MDTPWITRPLYTNLFFLFLLLSSNLLTFYFSSFQSCSFNPTTDLSSNDASTKDDDLPPEFVAVTSPQPLPFGFSANYDSDTIYPPVGHPCTLFKEDLNRYMSYNVNGSCPEDEALAQKLLLRGCEPLPRRRCRPAANRDYVEPFPLPKSLWATPSDASVVWTAYSCKNYACLVDRKNQEAFDDCKDCFDLEGREKTRWTSGTGLDFSIDEVLATRRPGTVRIGLDIGGNLDLLSKLASLYLSISQRLPFFDNTLDIVHSMHVLSNWIPTQLLHFLLYDVYRVLRPGGLFWLDHFFCVELELEVYVPLIESIGFDKVKWVVGRKLDRGPERGEMYISAMLEKPLKRSS